LDAWNQNVAVNLTGIFHICKNVVPSMIEKRWGRIINIAGISPYIGGDSAKAMVKLGTVGLTRGLAFELAEYSITANCVGPGSIERPFEDGVRPKELSCQPMLRWGRQDEAASLMVYLASEAAGYITGQSYLINGGRYFQ
jgi:NAD(P)-dependent dehydrogenase (short-subunit alcohol dehydrogenase family)